MWQGAVRLSGASLRWCAVRLSSQKMLAFSLCRKACSQMLQKMVVPQLHSRGRTPILLFLSRQEQFPVRCQLLAHPLLHFPLLLCPLQLRHWEAQPARRRLLAHLLLQFPLLCLLVLRNLALAQCLQCLLKRLLPFPVQFRVLRQQGLPPLQEPSQHQVAMWRRLQCRMCSESQGHLLSLAACQA